MTIRISGLVRAARRAHERIQAGIPAAEREAFLRGLRRTLETVDGILRDADAGPRDLPGPSRRAAADLERLAALEPEVLPLPSESGHAPKRVAVRNVIRTRDQILDALAEASPDGPPPSIALDLACSCVETVEAILGDHGADPSALSSRNRQAFVLLRWLAQEQHFALYARQVARARRAFEERLRDAAGAWLGGEHSLDPGLEPRVRFLPGRTAWATQEDGARLEVKLHVGFLSADDGVLRAVADTALSREARRAPSRKHALEFMAGPACGARAMEFELPMPRQPEKARGRAYDLAAVFDEINQRYFEGALRQPHLAWWHGSSRGRFGFHDRRRNTIQIDIRLDDDEVPGFVLEYVLYHEMLHMVHPPEKHGTRVHSHTPAFRRAERRHPRHAEAELWLGRLTRRDATSIGAPAATPKPTKRVVVRHAEPSKHPRNAPCLCGSGSKYKKCCGRGT